MEPERWVTFSDCAAVRETAKAVLVLSDVFNDDNGVWFPKSVISEDSEVQGDEDNGDLIVLEWFAKKEGLL